MTSRSFTMLTAFLLLTTLAVPVLAAPPTGYYDSVETTSLSAFRASLNNVIDGHTKIPYTSSSTDTWNVLELADQDPNNSSRILDVYQNRDFIKHGGGNDDYNREHTWPKSYGFPDDGSSNKPYSDCHHLFLCDIGYNGNRDSLIYNNCSSGCTSRPADNYNGESGTNYYSGSGWETWIGRRGDVARALMYMDVRYEGAGSEPDLVLTNNTSLIANCQTGDNESVGYMGLLSVLVQWHIDDPVDDKERNRNDKVYQYQGNRNPFIDHPEWVDPCFGGGSFATSVDDLPVANLPTSHIADIYPNPFNPMTQVELAIAQDGLVQVEVYSLQGKLVRTLVNEIRTAGVFAVMWDGRSDAGDRVSSGAYFCRLKAGAQNDVRKVLLLK